MAARITRFESAPKYSPPLHTNVAGRRLQGLEAGPTRAFWVGHSLYPPGADSDLAPTAAETVYFVIDGQLTLYVEDQGETLETLLGPGDSVHFDTGTMRRVENASPADVQVLVAIANPKDPA